jgi:outer membrane lipoprotein SlyB
MEASQSVLGTSPVAASSTHPLLLVAAGSVTILSLAGASYFAGWLPGPATHATESRPVAAVTTATAPAVSPPISVTQSVTLPQEKPKVASRPTEAAAPIARRSVANPVVRAPEPVSVPTIAVASAPTPVAAPVPAICRECGVVESVREVAVEAKGSGGGAVAGGIVGGVIGNQWGRGATRDIATVLGAIGGAYAGNHIEKSIKESKRYDVSVRFEDGSIRSFSSDTLPTWHVGDRVRLQNGLLTSGGGRSSMDLGSI